MTILSLNLWGGKEFNPLMTFLAERKGSTDVFCFQEMLFGTEPGYTSENKGRINLHTEIVALLSEFVPYEYRAAPNSNFAGEELGFDIGQAVFVRKEVVVRDSGGFRTYLPDSVTANDPRTRVTGNCQWVEIEDDGQQYTILNLHGLWQPGSHKLDTPERIAQSDILRSFMDARTGHTILIGDFNMRPEIESMDMLRTGMQDLIAEYGVTSTRSSLYDGAVPYSDYAIVSPEVSVAQFAVLPDEVSDHLPLLLSV